MQRFERVLPILEHQWCDTSGESIHQKLEKSLKLAPCARCHSLSLKPEAMAVRVGTYRIHELTKSTVSESLHRILEVMGIENPALLNTRQNRVGDLVLLKIHMRLKLLFDVALGYPNPDRPAMTLSGYDPANPSGNPHRRGSDMGATRTRRAEH